MPSRLKLGLVGAGPVAEKYHVPAIRAVPEFSAWQVADIDLARARHLAELVPFNSATVRTEDLHGNVDAAVIALPNALHQAVACQLLEAGIHVLCEKPMARTVAECRQMIASAKKGHALLCIGHARRLRANVADARRLIEKGLLGRIIHIEAEEGSTSDWPRSRAYFDPQIAGGGALIDVGIHSIDIIRYLAGEFAAVEYAGNQTLSTVESHCELRFTLVNGATGKLVASREQNLRQQIVLQGDEGELTVGLWGQELFLRNKSGKAFQHLKNLQLNPVRRAMDASFVEQLFMFAKAILGTEKLPVTGMEGMRAVEVVEWAYTGVKPTEMVN